MSTRSVRQRQGADGTSGCLCASTGRSAPSLNTRVRMLAAIAISCGLALLGGTVPQLAASSALRAVAASGATAKSPIPYRDAASVFEALRADLLPAELRSMASAQREMVWLDWVLRRDEEIRSRLIAGDEDSVVNLLWFGSTFTSQPRMTAQYLATLDQAVRDTLLESRLDALVAGILSPGVDERLQFARGVVERQGIEPVDLAHSAEVKGYLAQIILRTLRELDLYQRSQSSRQATLYSERGLSSDTSIFVDFAIDRALDELASGGVLRTGSVQRVAVVGPGLDVVDKENGYDFFPLQTIQPFAVADSLIRLGLAASDLRVSTFDVSGRVNEHLVSAHERARAGAPYVVHLPRDTAQPWRSELVTYWQRFGSGIGEVAAIAAVPEGAPTVDVRSVQIDPRFVISTVPEDLNIILERQDLEPEHRFDLIIGTNILLYYDVFEQSLALSNLAAMLQPQGLFLSNDHVYPLPGIPMTIVGDTEVSYTGDAPGDFVIWYQRR